MIVPSTMASTPNSLPICGNAVFVFLYCSTDVCEITRKPPDFARSVINSSVMPSLKYSCSGLFERLRNGSTATERILEAPSHRVRKCSRPKTKKRATNDAAVTNANDANPHRIADLLVVGVIGGSTVCGVGDKAGGVTSGAINRYPRLGKVSRNRGCSALSSSTLLICRIA